MNFTEFIRSRIFTGIIIAVGALVALLVTFQAGVVVGTHRVEFAYQWGEEYHQNFGGPRGGFIHPLTGPALPNPHATFGKVVRITLPAVTVASGDVEKVITIGDDTIIRRLDSTATATELKVGDQVVVIGEPDDQARIQATFVRVMPTVTPTPQP